MKAMMLESHSDIRSSPLILRDSPIPEPQSGEVRVKVSCCAICRTDLHVIEGELPTHRQPLIPGHQVVGVVDATGPDVTQWKKGTRIGIAWLRKTCGHCSYCLAGQENLCGSALFTGYDDHGGFAEYALVDAAFCYRLPETLSDWEAAPLLCAGIIGYRALKRANLKKRERLGIYGFGSSAHIVAQIARFWDCEIYVVTRGEKHQSLARRLGVDWVGGLENPPPVLLDSAIIFAPAGDLVPKALEALKKGGTLSLAGIYMSQIPVLNYEKHLFYEKNICSVTANTREDGQALLDLAGTIPLRPSITVYGLEQANQALMDLKADQIEGTGVLTVQKS